MKTGKAAVLVKPDPLETWDVPVPDPVDGGVLAAVQSGAVVKALIDPSIV